MTVGLRRAASFPEVTIWPPMRRNRQVTVSAPARLHFGFLDMHGGLGRRFGGLGLTVSGIRTRLTVRHGTRASSSAAGPGAQRALRIARRLQRRLGLDRALHVEIERIIPEHVGLGSGTQLALAVGRAALCLHGRDLPTEELAALLGRGRRSGIGVGAFRHGGFLLDGGHGRGSSVPPLIGHWRFPAEWRLLLAFDRDVRGRSGVQERRAFQALSHMPQSVSSDLCRLVLMQLLPALAERRCDRFGTALAELQRAVGEYFSSMQGGLFASARVARVLEWARGEGACGYGQSSWGPTGFALFATEERARLAHDAALRRWGADPALAFRVIAGRNRGAVVHAVQPSRHAGRRA